MTRQAVVTCWPGKYAVTRSSHPPQDPEGGVRGGDGGRVVVVVDGTTTGAVVVVGDGRVVVVVGGLGGWVVVVDGSRLSGDGTPAIGWAPAVTTVGGSGGAVRATPTVMAAATARARTRLGCIEIP
jgi:hypothetical protein